MNCIQFVSNFNFVAQYKKNALHCQTVCSRTEFLCKIVHVKLSCTCYSDLFDVCILCAMSRGIWMCSLLLLFENWTYQTVAKETHLNDNMQIRDRVAGEGRGWMLVCVATKRGTEHKIGWVIKLSSCNLLFFFSFA